MRQKEFEYGNGGDKPTCVFNERDVNKKQYLVHIKQEQVVSQSELITCLLSNYVERFFLTNEKMHVKIILNLKSKKD